MNNCAITCVGLASFMIHHSKMSDSMCLHAPGNSQNEFYVFLKGNSGLKVWLWA